MGKTRKHGIAKGGNSDFCIGGGIVANTDEETAPSGEPLLQTEVLGT